MSKYFGIWTRIGEIESDLGQPYVTCSAWWRRGEIPRRYDGRLIEVLRSKGFEISFASLDSWHTSHAERKKRLRDAGLPYECENHEPFPPFPWVKPVKSQEAAE